MIAQTPTNTTSQQVQETSSFVASVLGLGFRAIWLYDHFSRQIEIELY